MKKDFYKDFIIVLRCRKCEYQWDIFTLETATMMCPKCGGFSK